MTLSLAACRATKVADAVVARVGGEQLVDINFRVGVGVGVVEVEDQPRTTLSNNLHVDHAALADAAQRRRQARFFRRLDALAAGRARTLHAEPAAVAEAESESEVEATSYLR